jgi:hypothetical protein
VGEIETARYRNDGRPLTYPPGSTERRGDFEIKQQSRGAEVRLDFKGEAKYLLDELFFLLDPFH